MLDFSNQNNNLRNRPLYEEVADQLRSQIFAHQLPPGSWLDEQKLAKDYGISRTPMREAIKVLAAEGLITMKLRRGAYVTEVNRQDLEQIFTVLSLLEGEAARNAAHQASESDLNELDNLHLRLEKAAADRNLELFFEMNVRFHERILAISGNRWMNGVITDLRKVLKLQRRDSLTRSGRLQQSLNEHREILKALLKRDSIAAEAAMRNHLARGLEASTLN
jgi:DNA-binding GntR family transcriptional regulator